MTKLLRKLSNKEKKCNICEGILRKLDVGEKKRIRLRFDLPRGIYICEECNNIATIGLTPIDIKSGEWTEIVESLNQDEFINEKNAIDKILETVSVLPEQHTIVISLGHLFKCEEMGVKCSLYKIASSGLGPKEFCPSGRCNYDPYPQEYKNLFWFKTKSSWPKNKEVISCWFNIIMNKTNNAEIRVDAINRVGTIAIQRVNKQLCALFFNEETIEIREAILAALNKQETTTETEQILHYGLGYNSPVSTQLLLLKQLWQLRIKHHHYDIVWLAQKVSYLTASQDNKVKEEARKTLQLLEKQASKEKPDIKMMAVSAKD